MQKTLKKTSMFALAGILSVGMLAGSFSMDKVNAAAVNAASITVGKTLTVNGTSFPNIPNFTFQLEAVSGYTNPNPSTSVDGQTIAAAAVPMPAGATGTTVTKTVGDFTTSATGDTATARTRKDAFADITYTTAGYYLYRLTEVIPNTPVAGVNYDQSSYYVVVYVVNNTDASDNTTTGVKVKSITAWHNAAGSSANAPDLADIADGGGDNGGDPAQANTTWGNSGEQRYDTLGKVGISDSQTPNELDATLFWNSQDMHDVTINKNVKGDLGDLTKEFEFTVTLTGLEANQPYQVVKTGGATLVSASVGSVNNTAGTVTTNASGNATFLVKLTDDQGITLKNLPNGATYRVSEAASNHTPSYAVTSDNTATGANAPVIASASGNTSGAKETALATAQETVNATDGNVTVAYTNKRDLETLTGLNSYMMFFMAMGLIALAGLLVPTGRRRRGFFRG